MKIAIVGTSNLTQKIYNTLSEEKDLELVIFEGDKISEIIEDSKKMDDSIEGIIFTGIGMYSLAVNRYDYGIPTVYTTRNISSVTNVFFKLYEDYKDLSSLRIGIDTVREIDLLDFFEEYNIEIKNYKIQTYSYPQEEIDFIEKYLEQYKNGEIDCIITASGYVYKYFKGLGIPVYSLKASRAEIRESYNELRREIERSQLDNKVALVQIFDIKDEAYKYINKEDKARIKEMIYTYSKEIEGMFHVINDRELMVISNKRSILADENKKCLSNIAEESEGHGIHLAIGIGEGETLYQAEDNARNAIRKGKIDQGTSIFYYDGSRVVGPVFEDVQLEYTTDRNKDYEDLVEEIGISHQYIEKIDAVKKKLGRDDFTSKELSEILLISERTANRILKKVIESGYGEEVGKEVSLGVGRPRRKIKILF